MPPIHRFSFSMRHNVEIRIEGRWMVFRRDTSFEHANGHVNGHDAPVKIRNTKSEMAG